MILRRKTKQNNKLVQIHQIFSNSTGKISENINIFGKFGPNKNVKSVDKNVHEKPDDKKLVMLMWLILGVCKYSISKNIQNNWFAKT